MKCQFCNEYQVVIKHKINSKEYYLCFKCSELSYKVIKKLLKNKENNVKV